MDIKIESPSGHKGVFMMEEQELLLFSSSITKLMPMIEENKNLGYASKQRLKVDERELLKDMSDRLLNVIEYIKKKEG